MALTLYLLDQQAGGSTHGSLQDGGGAPSVAATTTGWTIDATLVTTPTYAKQVYGLVRASSQFGTSGVLPGAGGPTQTSCWRSQFVYDGTIAAGTWTFAIAISAGAATTSTGKFGLRAWASADPTGQTGLTQITSTRLATTGATWTASSGQQNLTASASLALLPLAGQYLFLELAWEVDSTPVGSSQIVVVQDPTNSVVTTPAFTPTPPGGWAPDYPDVVYAPPRRPVATEQYEGFVTIELAAPGFGPFYLVDQFADDAALHGRAQDGHLPNAPTATHGFFGPGFATGGLSGKSTGWTTGATVASDYARLVYQTTRAASAFTATVQPSGVPNTQDSLRSSHPIAGYYPAGNWAIAIAVIATTIGGTPKGNLRLRVWASTDPAAQTGVRELTTSPLVLSTVTLSTSQVNSTVTWAAPEISLNGEFLFFQLAWEVTTAGTGAGNVVFLVQDATHSVITPTAFVPVGDVVPIDQDFPDRAPRPAPRQTLDYLAKPPLRERTQVYVDQDYPERAPDRRAFHPAYQLDATEQPRRPERTQVAFGVDFPDAVRGPYARALYQRDTVVPARPDRTSTLAAQDFPSTVRGAPYPAPAQPYALDVPPLPERTSVLAAQIFPETTPGPRPRQHEDVAALPAEPERTRPLAAQSYPEEARGRPYPAPAQPYALASPPRPERTATLVAADYPDPRQIAGALPRAQLPAGALPAEPERSTAIAAQSYPDEARGRAFPASAQQVEALQNDGTPPGPTVGGPFYLLDAAASSSSNGSLQDGGFPPGGGDTSTGWATPNTGNNSQDTVYAAPSNSTVGLGLDVVPPNGLNCWRSQSPLSGYWRAGTWTFAISMRVASTGNASSFHATVQIWASSNPTGVGARPLTTLTGTIPTPVALSSFATIAFGTFNTTGTLAMPSVGVEGEYLFLHVGVTSNGVFQHVLVRQDSVNSVVTPPAFVQTGASDYLAMEYPAVARGRALHPAYQLAVSVLPTRPPVTAAPALAPAVYPAALPAKVAPPGTTLDVPPRPERTSTLAAPHYPDAVPGARPPQHVDAPPAPPRPERPAPLYPLDYPERARGAPFPAQEQVFSLSTQPRPERTSPFAAQSYPELARGRALLTAAQQAALSIPPRPEAPVPDFAASFPEIARGRPFLPLEQPFGVDAPPEPERPLAYFATVYPDRLARAAPAVPTSETYPNVEDLPASYVLDSFPERLLRVWPTASGQTFFLTIAPPPIPNVVVPFASAASVQLRYVTADDEDAKPSTTTNYPAGPTAARLPPQAPATGAVASSRPSTTPSATSAPSTAPVQSTTPRTRR